MSQTKPINKMRSNLSLSQSDANPRATPVLTTNILETCHDSEKFDQYFLCPSIIGKLNYLLHSNGPDIVYVVHQCSQFSEDRQKPHGEAIKRIASYLTGT